MSIITQETLESVLKKCLLPCENKISDLIAKVKELETKIDHLQNGSKPKPQADKAIEPSPSFAETARRTTTNSPDVSANRPPTKTLTAPAPITARTQRATARSNRPSPTVANLRTQPAAATRKSLSTPPPTGAIALAKKQLDDQQTRSENSDTIMPTDTLNELTCKSQDINKTSTNYNTDSTEWQEVQRKKRRQSTRPRNVVRGTGCQDSDLKTVERSKKLHACFLCPETTEESMVAFMKKKNPGNDYRVEKLKLKHNYYASFAISMPSSKFEFFMDPNIWPPRTEVSEWFRHGDRRAARPSPAAAIATATATAVTAAAAATGPIPGPGRPSGSTANYNATSQ